MLSLNRGGLSIVVGARSGLTVSVVSNSFTYTLCAYVCMYVYHQLHTDTSS